MRHAIWVLGLALTVCAFAQSPAPASRDDKVRAALAKALELAKANRDADAAALLDKILKASPKLASARLLRAKVLYRLKRFEDAEADAALLAKEAPGTPGISELLARIREHIKPVTVTVVGGKQKYSEWVWSWSIDGSKSFKLEDFKGAQGYTLFFWPSRPDVQVDWDKLEADASSNLYFLRVILLRGEADTANLYLPGAKDFGITAAPYMMWMDETGKVVAKGEVKEVLPKIDEFKKAKKDAATPVELISKVDVSTEVPKVDSYAKTGWTTIVMVTSPACHDCVKHKPKVEKIPETNAKVRLVELDVGTTATGGINWDAPFRLQNKVPELPYFYVLDAGGKLSGSGSMADGILKTWLAE